MIHLVDLELLDVERRASKIEVPQERETKPSQTVIKLFLVRGVNYNQGVIIFLYQIVSFQEGPQETGP